jgi:hypothetical protein
MTFTLPAQCPCGDGERPGHPLGLCDDGLKRLMEVSGGRLSLQPPLFVDEQEAPARTDALTPCGPIATCSWCCEYHGIHSEDEHERELADARAQALASVTALRDVKNERDKAEAELKRLRRTLGEHAEENVRLHAEVERLKAILASFPEGRR